MTKERKLRTVFNTQHEVALAWADWVTDFNKTWNHIPEFRNYSGHFRAEGRELYHYRTVQEWVTADSLLIDNSDCWDAGFAHCTTVRTSDSLSLEALKAEGIDHLSIKSMGTDDRGGNAYSALRHGKLVIFRETERMQDDEYNSNRRLSWLEIFENEQWVRIHGIRCTGRNHDSEPADNIRAWLKEKANRRKGYFKGLANHCKEIIPTKKNFDWLGVELIETPKDFVANWREQHLHYERRTMSGKPGLYYHAGHTVRIIETWTTIHNPRALVWKIAAVDREGVPQGIGLFGKDETGQLWFYEFPMRFRNPAIRHQDMDFNPFGQSSVYAPIVEMERALLGMKETDVLVAEA